MNAFVNLGCSKVIGGRQASLAARPRVRVVTMATKQIEVIRKADEDTIKKIGCRSWGVWSCDAGSFPWTYTENEQCLLIEGDVTVTPDGGAEPVSFEAGDIVTFPAGMSCSWDVRKPVKKYFNFY